MFTWSENAPVSATPGTWSAIDAVSDAATPAVVSERTPLEIVTVAIPGPRSTVAFETPTTTELPDFSTVKLPAIV